MTTKNVLLILSSPINKLSEEALLAVFALASFEHHIQIALTGEALELLKNPAHKLCHMLASIELYDIPAVWLVNDKQNRPMENDLNLNHKNHENNNNENNNNENNNENNHSNELAFATLAMAANAPDFLNTTHAFDMVWQV